MWWKTGGLTRFIRTDSLLSKIDISLLININILTVSGRKKHVNIVLWTAGVFDSSEDVTFKTRAWEFWAYNNIYNFVNKWS